MNALVAKMLGTRLGRLLNSVCSIGTGVAQPTGIVTGVAASGNVYELPTGETASISYNDLVGIEGAVDVAYRYQPSTFWMFSDSMLTILKRLVDGNNRPLWQPAISSSFLEGAGIQGLVDTRPTILDYSVSPALA